jgi:hypothetical protein
MCFSGQKLTMPILGGENQPTIKSRAISFPNPNPLPHLFLSHLGTSLLTSHRNAWENPQNDPIITPSHPHPHLWLVKSYENAIIPPSLYSYANIHYITHHIPITI